MDESGRKQVGLGLAQAVPAQAVLAQAVLAQVVLAQAVLAQRSLQGSANHRTRCRQYSGE